MPASGLGPRRWLAVPLCAALAVSACLRTLDHSKLDESDGSGGGGGSAGAGTGASGGSGGAGGTDTGGSGGASGGSGGAQPDGPVDHVEEPDGFVKPTFTAYDPLKYPVTGLALSAGEKPLIICADASDLFRTTFAGASANVNKMAIANGSAVLVTAGIANPRALAAPNGALNLFIVGQASGGADLGYVMRLAKNGLSAPTAITSPPQFETANGLCIGADNFGYATAKALVAGSIELLRFSIAAGAIATETLYISPTGGEIAGDVTVSGACAYWITDQGMFVISTAGGTRSPALVAQVKDGVGITSDTANFYYTRKNGEVWQRKLSGSACDGAGEAEKRIASGFVNLGDVVTYNNTVAWAAMGDTSGPTKTYDGGGIFTTPVGGVNVTQIAPQTDGVDDIDHGATDVVFTTTIGGVKKVPKTAL